MEKRRHLFIINPKSFPLAGSQERVRKQIADYFAGKDERDYSIAVSTYPREAIIIIRDFVARVKNEDAPDTIVRVYAIGGDGIIFDCVNGLVGLANTELACIPYGSSNDFVRGFGPNVLETFRNIKLQAESGVISTDVIKCGNQQNAIYSLCDCLFGVEAAAAFNISQLTRKSTKLPAFLRKLLKNILYTWGGLKAVFDRNVITQKYKILIDGEDISGGYATINISNTPCYGGDKNPVLTADPTDGYLDMLTTEGVSPLTLLPVFTRYLAGKYSDGKTKIPTVVRHGVKKPVFRLRRVKKVTIQPESPQLMVNLDGEAFFDLQATVEVIPGGVQVVTPGGIAYRRWIDRSVESRIFGGGA